MMYRASNLPCPPERFIDHLDAIRDEGARGLRRRAVLGRSTGGAWALVCCTVEGRTGVGQGSGAVLRRYPEALLYEDWLTTEDCRKFIDEIQRGDVELGTVPIACKANRTWHAELVPLKNMYMGRAGLCVASRIADGDIRTGDGPLLTPGEPYYPDVWEAARHWLPFTSYQGQQDSRRGEIIFLLAEFRAFLGGADVSPGKMRIRVEGSAVEELDLTVKGGYWDGTRINHIDAPVTERQAMLHVPDGVDRLEYALVDSHGVVYDFQREDRFNHSGLGRRRLDTIAQELVEQVRNACAQGEGMQVEFKPFINCNEGMGTKSKKTKLRELATTVVSFANTQGGRIYVGIDDECGLSGIGPELEQWGKVAACEELIARYCGALTNRIKGETVGDVPVRVSCTAVDDVRVVIVDVSPSPAKPVMVRGDNIFYVRAGASNRQLPPDQWGSILGGQAADRVAMILGLT